MNNRIREFRSAQGLSQAELGKKLNVAGATVSSWEQNRTEPNMEQSIKMANLFGCTLNDLFGEPNSQQELTQDELLFIEAYRNSDKEKIFSLFNEYAHLLLSKDGIYKKLYGKNFSYK